MVTFPTTAALLFAGMPALSLCVVGVTHQTAWLAASKERLLGVPMEAARRNQSNNNLKQIGFGCQMHDEAAGALPAAATFDESGRPLHSWQTRLLPFIEQVPLYKRVDMRLPWDADENKWAFSKEPPPYLHPKVVLQPDQRGYARSSYAGNAYVLGGTKAWPLAKITDGTSKTILCGEAITAPRPWADPVNWRDPAAGIGQRADSFGGAFQGTTQFVFADGHTTSISNKIDPAVLRALCTPTSGETVPAMDDN